MTDIEEYNKNITKKLCKYTILCKCTLANHNIKSSLSYFTNLFVSYY